MLSPKYYSFFTVIFLFYFIIYLIIFYSRSLLVIYCKSSSMYMSIPNLVFIISTVTRVCSCLVAQLCLTLCDPKDCSPPGSSVHGIFQARILSWVAISFSRGYSTPRANTDCWLVTINWFEPLLVFLSNTQVCSFAYLFKANIRKEEAWSYRLIKVWRLNTAKSDVCFFSKLRINLLNFNTLGFVYLRNTLMVTYFPAPMKILIFSFCIKIDHFNIYFGDGFIFNYFYWLYSGNPIFFPSQLLFLQGSKEVLATLKIQSKLAHWWS